MAVGGDKLRAFAGKGGEKSSLPTYPPDHQLGMAVTKGGSMCANCGMLGDDGESCKSEYFKKWDGASATPEKPAGSDALPAPADEYCCDLWGAA